MRKEHHSTFFSGHLECYYNRLFDHFICTGQVFKHSEESMIASGF